MNDRMDNQKGDEQARYPGREAGRARAEKRLAALRTVTAPLARQKIEFRHARHYHTEPEVINAP